MQLYHCGDLTEPDMVKYFRGFRVAHVFGNVDSCIHEIITAWKELDPGNWSGKLFTQEIEGVPVAMVHGHVDGEVNSLVLSKEYEYVFYGHTHRRRDEMIGNTRVINPGALNKSLMGYSICILDIKTGEVQFKSIG